MVRIFSNQIHSSHVKTQPEAQQECVNQGGNLVTIDEVWKLDYIRVILASCGGNSNSHNIRDVEFYKECREYSYIYCVFVFKSR